MIQRSDAELIAEVISNMPKTNLFYTEPHVRVADLVEELASAFKQSNVRFKKERFIEAAMAESYRAKFGASQY